MGTTFFTRGNYPQVPKGGTQTWPPISLCVPAPPISVPTLKSGTIQAFCGLHPTWTSCVSTKSLFSNPNKGWVPEATWHPYIKADNLDPHVAMWRLLVGHNPWHLGLIVEGIAGPWMEVGFKLDSLWAPTHSKVQSSKSAFIRVWYEH